MNATQLDERGIIEACPSCGQKNRIQYGRLGSVVRCGQCKTELPQLDVPIEIDEEVAFDSLVETSSLPVVVDFWADWCGPCKMMAPEVKRLAAHSVGKFVVAKVNTEGLPMVAQRFHINTIPTLVLFLGGKEAARTQGAQPAVQLQKFVEHTIRSAAEER